MAIFERMAGALSFAHLAGLTSKRSKRARSEDEDDRRKDGEEAEDEGEDKDDDRAEDDRRDSDDDRDEDRRGKRGRRAKRAEGDSEDEEEDGDNEDEGDDTRGKRGRRAESDDDADADEDDDDEEMTGKGTAARARARERQRFAAIFSSKYAARNLSLAMSLACNSTMSRRQVIAVLRDTPAGNQSSNSDRAARNPGLGGGSADRPSRTAEVQGRWDRAMSKVRGK